MVDLCHRQYTDIGEERAAASEAFFPSGVPGTKRTTWPSSTVSARDHGNNRVTAAYETDMDSGKTIRSILPEESTRFGSGRTPRDHYQSNNDGLIRSHGAFIAADKNDKDLVNVGGQQPAVDMSTNLRPKITRWKAAMRSTKESRFGLMGREMAERSSDAKSGDRNKSIADYVLFSQFVKAFQEQRLQVKVHLERPEALAERVNSLSRQSEI